MSVEEEDNKPLSSQSQGVRSKRGRSHKDSPETRTNVLLLKMCLQNAQGQRSLAAVAQYTVQMPLALQEAVAMQKAGREYHAKATNNKQHNLGEPFVHTFGSLIMTSNQ